MQTQGSKDSFRFKESKPKDPKPTPPHDNVAEPAKKEGKKKKRSWEHSREHMMDKKEQFAAIGINSETPKKRSGPNALIITKKITIQIIVSNFQKTSIGLDNLCVGDWY